MLSSTSQKTELIVLARRSPLSQVQVSEVQAELDTHVLDYSLQPKWIDTLGDKDKSCSLRTMERCDFFTREIDHQLLEGKGRIAVHSAKDLPEALAAGLSIIAITRGVDPSDSLVLAEGYTLESLPSGAVIATSSIRREDMVRDLRDDLAFCDIRGTISERIQKIDSIEIFGVVIAEAALIRLGLTQLNRIHLPGETVALQGQLAIVARSQDAEMAEQFACLDTRPLRIPHD